MIARIHGALAEIDGDVLVIDTAGVGYEVEVSSGTLGALPPIGGDLTLHTHQVVRDDAHLLFGFAERAEREVFRALIRINGVGPKLALALISSLSLGELARCVGNNDLGRLTKVPGVGKKTAERLVIELRDKLDLLPVAVAPEPSLPTSDALREAEEALSALGYRPGDVRRVLEEVHSDGLETAALVRLALQSIGRRAESGR